MKRIIKWTTNNWFIIFLLFTSATLRFIAYNKISFANGWDAYFYLVQIKSYLEEGQMHSSRLSLFYPFLILIKWICGNYELAYKLSSAIAAGLFSAAVFSLSKSLNKSGHIPYLLGLFTIASFHLTFVAGQYTKNLLGVAVYLFMLSAFFRKKYIFSLLLFISNLFIHKMTAGISLISLFLIVGFQKLPKKYTVFAIISSAILLAAVLILPFIINVDDFSGRGFTISNPHLPGLSFIYEMEAVISPYWLVELILSMLIFLWAVIVVIYKHHFDYRWIFLLTILSLLSFPFFEWSVLGISFRFFIVFVLMSPLLFNLMNFKLPKPAMLVVSLLFVTGGIYGTVTYNPTKYDPPYALYYSISSQLNKITKTKDIELIIGHKAMAEYITFKTGIDVLPWQPEYDIQKEKLWRIGTGINQRTAEYFSGGEINHHNYQALSIDYFLVREDVWQKIITNIKTEDEMLYDKLMTWKNPHEIRPDYLLKKR